ncbi:Peptidyl-Lys metalloendopeptidase [Rhizoctonia solani]|uniref:Peptidyl-Lys metalloendopeptidase n=1 Tax=Rhizoctonia solani TaxID=456999 RepID=A0A0K6G8I3_9AGAM|nr:Peptidyl-Lys metalloendopeptidase [Rhizoctonia solani]
MSSKTCTPQFTGLNVRYDLSHAAKSIGASSFVALAPGMTTEVEHNLAGTYDFTQCGEGSYKLTASNTFYYIDGSGKPNVIKASTRSRQLKITGMLAAPRQHAKTGVISEPGIKVIGCTDNQKEQVEKAISAANTMINESNRYLASLTQASSQPKRYTTWFGAINDLRYNSLTYDCNSCPNNPDDVDYHYTYTYTLNEEPKRIILCRRFWQTARSTGSPESQAGLIIRELSHSAETETLDLVYGIEGARALAAKDAWLGIMNADNYMYFAKKGSGLSFITTR